MCGCCRRRHAGTRRRPRRGNVGPADTGRTNPTESVTVDPIGGHLLHIDRLPEQNITENNIGGKSVSSGILNRNEAMVLPTTGKTALKRVFLGVGWRTEEKVDVDCCCAPYANGQRSEEDTVWYNNLNSSVDQGYCFTKHSGDILTGQVGGGALEDLERIYVDLENCPVNYDCLAFEANVYTNGYTFGAIDSCYIRLVNADTNQEILRCDMQKDTFKNLEGGSLVEKRVVLLAKLFRGDDRWLLHSTIEGRDNELRSHQGVQPEMIVPCGSNVNEKHRGGAIAPESHVIDRADTYAVDTKTAKRPSRTFLAPAMALGSAAGIAAAVAIFKPEALSLDGMQAAGVDADFSNLVEIFQGTDCGLCNDFDLCGMNVGETAGGAFDFCFRGGLCNTLDVPNPCAIFGPIGDPLFGCVGTAVYEIGELLTGCCDGLSDCCGSCLGAPPEDFSPVLGCDGCNSILGGLCGTAGGIIETLLTCDCACPDLGCCCGILCDVINSVDG